MWKLSPRAQDLSNKIRARHNERLKARRQDPITDYELDADIYKQIPFAHPCRHEFLLRLYSHQWPEEMVIEADGYVNYWAVRMAQEACRQTSLILLGCGSSGKSYGAAGYCYTTWKINALWSSVYISTTSAEAGEARAYGTVKGLHKKDRYRLGKLIDSLRVITLDEETRNEDGDKERDYRNCVKAVLIKSGAEGKNVVGTICGRKNQIVVWCCDEMAFMDTGVLDARINLYSNATRGGLTQFIGVGNGPAEGDPLYLDAEPYGKDFPDGWRSVDKDKHTGWPTKLGYCLYFNGEHSPNLMVPRDKRPPFHKIMDWDSKAQMEKMSGGVDTPMYYKQVIGLPPSIDVPDKIITHKLLESNRALEQPVWMDLKRITVAGLDLGFRKDGDPCVLSFGQIGTEERGEKILAASGDARALLSKAVSQDAFEKQIATQVIDRCREAGCHDLALDVTGDGGILLQHIEREAREQKYPLNVVPVSFSGVADDTVRTPGEKRLPTEIYGNKMSQLWAQLRVLVINKSIRGLSAHFQAVGQLCGRKFATDDKKRFLVEPKKDYKKRLRRSPDHADAFALMAFMALKVGLSNAPVSGDERERERRDRWEEQMTPDGYSGHATIGGYGGH
jgi:hypothetical protein